LPHDCRPTLRSFLDYADWRARQAGDLLSEDEAGALMLLQLYRVWDEALREGREEMRADL
jgi:hypothetical protein